MRVSAAELLQVAQRLLAKAAMVLSGAQLQQVMQWIGAIADLQGRQGWITCALQSFYVHLTQPRQLLIPLAESAGWQWPGDGQLGVFDVDTHFGFGNPGAGV